MGTQVFAVVSIVEAGPNTWNASGRAYEDVHLGDVLADTPAGPGQLRVSGISTYGKPTDLLSRMMTGTLQLSGQLSILAPTGLYRVG